MDVAWYTAGYCGGMRKEWEKGNREEKRYEVEDCENQKSFGADACCGPDRGHAAVH